jgi:hypothetical protein
MALDRVFTLYTELVHGFTIAGLHPSNVVIHILLK